jgi:ribonucleoside-diphosphate reductase alpha chain
MTNLCTEVTLPTKPFENPFDGSGEIALCVLAAINAGKLNDQNKDLIRLADLLVRALDELLDYQEYPVAAGAHGALRRRSLGIGITGFSHWKAKNNIRYNSITSEDYEKIDDFAQAWSYALIRASVEVAKEKGPCDLISHTKYAGGVLPIDTYKKEVDEIVPHKDKQDWGSLRDDLSNYGIRNSTLMAFMPAETSSLISNSTNGIEDPRGPISIKINKDQVSKQVVPEIKKYGRRYDYLWNQNSPIPYLKTMAIFQKYMDQSISVNTSYNPKNFPGDEISMNTLLQDLLTFYKYGGKCLYYFNTNDNAGEEETEEGCDTCVI